MLPVTARLISVLVLECFFLFSFLMWYGETRALLSRHGPWSTVCAEG